jgi:FtsH-binding integral membrane protein
MIMGGKHANIGLDNYVLASLMLYLDIIQLFLKIVKILNELQKKEDNKKK